MAPEKDLVVLLHGLTGDPASVLRYAPETPDAEIFAPELPGHGRSPLVRPFHRDVIARAVGDDLAPRITDRVRLHVVGLSLGASLAWILAARFGAATATFVRPAHGTEQAPEHLSLNLRVADLLETDPMTAAAEIAGDPRFLELRTASPSAARNIVRKATVASPELARRRAELLREGSTWHRPGEPLESAVLVLAAERDGLHPIRIAEEWGRAASAAVMRVPAPDGAGHAEAVQRHIERQIASCA